jgi:ABC-type iron transport system FetAB permease component
MFKLILLGFIAFAIFIVLLPIILLSFITSMLTGKKVSFSEAVQNKINRQKKETKRSSYGDVIDIEVVNVEEVTNEESNQKIK